MSKLSQLRRGKGLIAPGHQKIFVISAPFGGNAEKVLRKIGINYDGRATRYFAGWSDEFGVLINRGSIQYGERAFELTLKLGSDEGLTLLDVPGKTRSINPINGKTSIGVGSLLSDADMVSMAKHIVGSWVVHGEGWTNRSGSSFLAPYHSEFQQGGVIKPRFLVVDGALSRMTLRELIVNGCTRSTHVGNWNRRHSTIVSALCGMPIFLHEFKAEGKDVCQFDDLEVSSDKDLWGPYCSWNEEVRQGDALGEWKDLAREAVSPFSFHVHATKSLFPRAILFSSFLLEKLGREKLRILLEIILAQDPERFYRLIDISGKTHRLTGIDQDSLIYGLHGGFSRVDAVNNVLTTLEELDSIQRSITFRMPRRNRLVLDSHFYLVIDALLSDHSPVLVLSGNEMHRYLTEGGSAKMHFIRNNRLFILLRDLFGKDEAELRVYPPIQIDSGLNNQYADLSGFRADDWLDRKI